MKHQELIEIAAQAMKNAYAPYSGFKVGAAVLTASGKIYTGVNIENATFGATCCAERTAVYKAVSEGEKSIQAVAIASSGTDTVFPCGICRQVMAEFGDDDLKILCSRGNGEYDVYTLGELLPHAFRLDETEDT